MDFKLWLENQNTPKDLPKSLSAREIKKLMKLRDHNHPTYAAAKGDDDKLLDMKYKEAQKDGLLKDVLKRGILDPLQIHVGKTGKQTLTHGHHRLAIALRHFPDKPIRLHYYSGKIDQDINKLKKQKN